MNKDKLTQTYQTGERAICKPGSGCGCRHEGARRDSDLPALLAGRRCGRFRDSGCATVGRRHSGDRQLSGQGADHCRTSRRYREGAQPDSRNAPAEPARLLPGQRRQVRRSRRDRAGHFQSWIDWAKRNHLGMDFNPTYFLSCEGGRWLYAGPRGSIHPRFLDPTRHLMP